jgi:malonyl CoA-acyl carrier protein transacylase
MKAFMFPGQGSQAKGMGAGLFERYRSEVAKCDAMLGYSIEQLCLEDPEGRLRNTLYTQPALYVVNALCYYRAVAGGARPPDYLLGHSLGEYNALLAAGCFDFETGLRLVSKRAELMSLVHGGAMAAVVNTSREAIERIFGGASIDTLDFSNFNTPSQVVISGPEGELEKVRPLLEGARMGFYPLNTSGAFHSRYMQPAREEFERFLAQFQFDDPRIPVIANVSARPYLPGSVAANLAQQIVSAVQWTGSVSYLRSLGEMEFEEIGAGSVLKKLLQTIRKQAAPVQSHDAENRPSEAAPTRMPAAALSSEIVSTAGARQQRAENADRYVADWNRRHTVGTRVTSAVLPGEILETRTAAVVLFGHRAAVYLQGYPGYFDLDDVSAVG